MNKGQLYTVLKTNKFRQFGLKSCLILVLKCISYRFLSSIVYIPLYMTVPIRDLQELWVSKFNANLNCNNLTSIGI